jgi:hypothetical protein
VNRQTKEKNMKTKCITVIALAVGLSAFNMVAQPAERPQGQRPGAGEGGADGPHREVHRKVMIPPIIAALDANHDGTISTDEIANAPAVLKTFDKNNDGAVQLEELRPKAQEGADEGKDGERKGPPPGGRRPNGPRAGAAGPDGGKVFHLPIPPVIAALDANGDKTISADEIANASNALKTLDKNGDGQLTKEELRPELPPRGDK